MLPLAYELVLEHRLRTLDAIHLAVAHGEAAVSRVEPIVFVTRDQNQAQAAQAMGLLIG